MAYQYTPSPEHLALRAGADVTIAQTQVVIGITRQAVEETKRLTAGSGQPVADRA